MDLNPPIDVYRLGGVSLNFLIIPSLDYPLSVICPSAFPQVFHLCGKDVNILLILVHQYAIHLIFVQFAPAVVLIALIHVSIDFHCVHLPCALGITLSVPFPIGLRRMSYTATVGAA